ncbi:dUTP diphosphatase [Salibacterium aidingense]|uniref:dUTP diphosphatase n=1 Tax=Salibacterium aidingense TaxID=384933 RepID=UPI00047BA5FF|nr:dUTP diphosphatase [Salibacterium aidingense]
MKQLFSIQRQLDDRILRQHSLNRDAIYADKMLALQVEIGELANETRCFKYWSKKPASDPEVILEEYVDGLHFILSLGIDGGWEDVPERKTKAVPTLTDQFHYIYNAAAVLHNEFTEEHFFILFQEYLELGRLLGFTEKEIEASYLRKNSANHQRQEEGY